MKKSFFAFLLLASSAFAQDGIDLTQAVYHGSPNISGWPVTIKLDTVEFKPGQASDGNTVGVRPVFDRQQMNARCPDVRPVGWQGQVQFTVWACVKTGAWHCAGLQEFWSDRNGSPRIWTGAPILTQWTDWVYRNQWGPEMEAYRPQRGDEIVFGLTCGDRRLMDLGDVRERSNFVRVTLTDVGVQVPLSNTSTPPTQPQPPSPPVIVTGLDGRVSTLEQQYRELLQIIDLTKGELRHEIGAAQESAEGLRHTVESLETEVVALKARPLVTGCRVSAFGVPVSCRLQ